MHRGYIRLWRNLEESGIMDNPDVCRLFIYLMLKASTRRRMQVIGRSGVRLEPGQVVVGRKMLAASLNTSESKIRICLQILQNMQMIELHANSKFTLVTILRWTQNQFLPDSPDCVSPFFPDTSDMPEHDPEAEDPHGDTPSCAASDAPADDRHPASGVPADGQHPASGVPADDQHPASGVPASSQHPATNKNKEYTHGEERKRACSSRARASPGSASGLAGPAAAPIAAVVHVRSGEDEFRQLRAFYDRHGRCEAPLAGFDAFRRCQKESSWPGTRAVMDAIGSLASGDNDWQRGFAPGLARFLRERHWEKSPARRTATVSGQDAAILNNMSVAAKLLDARHKGKQ